MRGGRPLSQVQRRVGRNSVARVDSTSELRLEDAVSWASSEERNSTATDHLSIPTTSYLQFLESLMQCSPGRNPAGFTACSEGLPTVAAAGLEGFSRSRSNPSRVTRSSDARGVTNQGQQAAEGVLDPAMPSDGCEVGYWPRCD